MYMYCAHCAKITNASIVGLLKDQLDCGGCGEREKLQRFRETVCSDCGETLYVPKTMNVSPACPCRSKAKPAEKKKAEKQDPPAAENPFVKIECERCTGILPYRGGKYGACPVCGVAPSDAYIIRQLYLLSGKKPPIVLKWDPAPHEMLFMHPNSEMIPKDSLIVVNPNQTAFYYANGKRRRINEGQIYAPRTGDTDIAQIARSIIENTDIAANQQRDLNTNLLFVDHSEHTYEPVISVALQNGNWTVDLEVEMSLQITSGENAEILLHNAFDFKDGVSVSHQLLNKVEKHITDELLSSVFQMSQTEMSEMTSEAQICNHLRNRLKQSRSELKESVNERLEHHLGITLNDVYFRPKKCTSNYKTEMIELSVRTTLPGGAWKITLPVQLSVIHPLDGEHAAQLIDQVKTDAEYAIENSLSAIAPDRLAKIENDYELRAMLNQWSSEQGGAIAASISQQAPALTLQALKLLTGKIDCEDMSSTQPIPCPFPGCGKIHRIPIGAKKYKCENLSSKVTESGKKYDYYIRWCTYCQKYTTDYERIMICDNCHKKYLI